ncbi:MAG: hypothetical protein N5P05_000955 [Chroococcopsis gigantea SAG 12.99]|jgi:hypothetical protein|nr:hypothetical protein [Chlorogloea purpurea SAG 13.99]MDV2999349.1 hypothetical protein [Chroococcopsis gigantea SAG 12.99]
MSKTIEENNINEILSQTVKGYELRNILTASGISKDVVVNISLSSDKKVIGSCELEPGDHEFLIKGDTKELQREMIKMIDYGEDKFALLRSLSSLGISDKIPLEITVASKDGTSELRFFLTWKCPCPDGIRACCNA